MNLRVGLAQLTEEERAALLEDFRSKLPAEKKDKKKAPGKARELTPEEMDALHKLEEEATQPRPQDVAVCSRVRGCPGIAHLVVIIGQSRSPTMVWDGQTTLRLKKSRPPALF